MDALTWGDHFANLKILKTAQMDSIGDMLIAQKAYLFQTLRQGAGAVSKKLCFGPLGLILVEK